MLDKPIVTSLAQTDFYKFPMDLHEQRYYQGINVVYRLKNRTTDIKLAEMIDEGELRGHLNHCRTLRFTSGELHWLGGTYEYQQLMFPIEYIESLRTFSLPEYNLEKDDGQYRLEFSGPGATHWEIISLLIINTLLNRARMKNMTRSEIDEVYSSGRMKLAQKIRKIRDYTRNAPKRKHQPFVFSDFGTRRCFSPEWQDYVVEVLKEELPDEFRGTSNCFLAKKHEVMPMGTNAHQSQMIALALAEEQDKDLKQALFEFYRTWGELFPTNALRILLPDTISSPFFFNNAPAELAKWRGARGDSGDLYQEGERIIHFFQKHGEDPAQKLYIPSDGLVLPLMFKLSIYFTDRIPVSHGWGSSLTNDMVDDPRFRPISSVVKPISANGRGTVKLSNNIAKAIGNPVDIQRYINELGYTETLNEKCTY